jgi:hypothetical protein
VITSRWKEVGGGRGGGLGRTFEISDEGPNNGIRGERGGVWLGWG